MLRVPAQAGFGLQATHWRHGRARSQALLSSGVSLGLRTLPLNWSRIATPPDQLLSPLWNWAVESFTRMSWPKPMTSASGPQSVKLTISILCFGNERAAAPAMTPLPISFVSWESTNASSATCLASTTSLAARTTWRMTPLAFFSYLTPLSFHTLTLLTHSKYPGSL